MKFKDSKLYKILREPFVLPPESKLKISERSLKWLTYASLPVSLFGLFELIFINSFYTNPTIDCYVYYSGLVIAGVISSIGSVLLRKFKSYNLNQFILMLSMTVYAFIFVYEMYTADIFLSSTTIFFTYLLVIILCFDVNPFFHTVIVIFYMVSLQILGIKLNLKQDYIFNNGVYCVVVIIFAFYKRKSTVRNEKQRIQIENQNMQLTVQNYELERQKDSLIVTKENLEQAVTEQNEEIQLQKEQIIKIQTNTIVSLANLVENRDEDTGEHVLRTRDYVGLITLQAFMSGEFPELKDKHINLFIKAASMHDIGKIVVSDSILKKPGRLTPEEFEKIKEHTIKGGKIVEEVLGYQLDKEYVQIAKDIATFHHEKYDGSGYPYGLKGEEIPLCARVMAIADVFDALVSPRCYKEPFSVEDSFTIIAGSAGTHFDPKLAKLFVESKDEVIKILNKYQEEYIL